MAKPSKPRAGSSRAPKSAPRIERPSREEAEQAVRTLIRWAGDDPDREGLLGTPDRVVRPTGNSSAATSRTRTPS